MSLWGGRFQKSPDQQAEQYSRSLDFDCQLAEYDVLGSIAHVRMLGTCKLIPSDDAETIISGLHHILESIRKDEIQWNNVGSYEDIHTYIEEALRQNIGAVAGKMHLGRSRNDQVALDLHLFLREKTLAVMEALQGLIQSLLNQAEKNIDTILPGYTHLQHAEPVRLAHHLLAYCGMFSRDQQRLMDAWKRCNISPLGAGAIAGSAVAIDRAYSANLMHFDGIYENSMDAVSDRDFLVEFLSHGSLIAMHLSRISEELILWCSHEFSFIELDDAFCTGSSMLPQKKNPDIAELARGKTGRVYGALFAVLTMLKGLPLTYNRDMQEDKEALFDSLHTIHTSLSIFQPMIDSMRVQKEKMYTSSLSNYSNATALANYLALKGLPFREGHVISGKIVFHCTQVQKTLSELSLEEYQKFSQQIEEDIYTCIDIDTVVESHAAGTARDNVEKQIANCKKNMERTEIWIREKTELIMH